MEQVLDTPELLENVLLQLPIRELLVNAPLVRKRWQDIIRDSPRLQQALFFKPLNGQPLRFIFRGTAAGWAEDSNDKHAYTVFRNPFQNLLTFEPNLPDRAFRSFATREAMLRPEASWQRMLLTQPPSIVTSRFKEEAKSGMVVARLSDQLLTRAWGSERSLCWASVEGMSHCKDVSHGFEVQRIVRPKAFWM